MALMDREEFDRVMVRSANHTAQKHGMPALSDKEASDLYEQYVRGGGSLFHVDKDEPEPQEQD